MTTPGGRVSLQTIYEDLSRRIQAGEFNETGQLPSTSALAGEYSISSPSVQKVIRQLRDAERVISRPGVGVFLRTMAPPETNRDSTGREASTATVAVPRMNHARLVDVLERRIRAGEFDSAGQLPSTSSLTKAYGVSAETIRKALRTLEDLGLVAGRQGVAVFLRPRPLYPWGAHDPLVPETMTAWMQAVTAKGGRPAQDPAQVSTERPPARIATAMCLDSTASAVVRRTLRRVDEVPIEYSEHWFPLAVAADTALMDQAPVVSISTALAAAGRHQVEHVDQITSEMANQYDAEWLTLETRTAIPVTRCTRTGYDGSGAVIRVSVSTARGDSEVRVYKLPG